VKITKIEGLLILALGSMAPAAVAAEGGEKPLVSIGMKVWNASWFSYLPGPYSAITPAGIPVRSDAIDAIEGERKTTTFPAMAVTFQKFSISASYAQYTTNLFAPHSSVIGPNGMNVQTSRTDHVSRKESDLGLAYALTPNISLSAGYKYVTETRDTSLGLTGGGATPFFDATLRGLVLGAQANFPIKDSLRFYGVMGYGPAKVKTRFADPSIGTLENNGRYLIGEIGLAYSLMISDRFVKGAYVALGYRSQTLKTDGVGPSFGDKRDYRDIRDGVILSLNVAI
jgi:hypothetical protein